MSPDPVKIILHVGAGCDCGGPCLLSYVPVIRVCINCGVADIVVGGTIVCWSIGIVVPYDGATCGII